MCWKWCFASFFGERGHWTLDEVCHLIFHIVKENFIFQTKWKEHWMGAILHIKAMRFSMVSSVVPWLLHDWIAGRQLEVDGTLASTSRHIILKEASARHTMEILVGKERNLKPAWKHFECLKMTKATWVFDFLWLCSLLVRDNVSAEHGWAKITEVLNQVTRLVVDSNGCGDSSITILAHKVPGPGWVTGQIPAFHRLRIYFDLGSNNLGSQGARVLGQSPDQRLAQRFGFFEPRSLELRLSWKTRNFLLLVYRWRVYSSSWNFLFVRLIGPCSFEAVICLFANVCYWC